MSTGTLLILDLVAAVVATAGWLGAGALAAGGRRTASRAAIVLALVATAGRAVTITLLARAGLWFVREKLMVAAPLQLVDERTKPDAVQPSDGIVDEG